MHDFQDLTEARQGKLEVLRSGSIFHQRVYGREVIYEESSELLPWACCCPYFFGNSELDPHLHSSEQVFLLLKREIGKLKSDEVLIQKQRLSLIWKHTAPSSASVIGEPPLEVSKLPGSYVEKPYHFSP